MIIINYYYFLRSFPFYFIFDFHNIPNLLPNKNIFPNFSFQVKSAKSRLDSLSSLKCRLLYRFRKCTSNVMYF